MKSITDSIISFHPYPNINVHPKCKSDLDSILIKSDIPAFVAAYKSRLSYLSQNMGNETAHREWFEVLKNKQGLRSIRFVSIQNIRIIYALDSEKAYLLLAFKEKQGHKKTEYSNYTDAAENRLKEKEEMQ